jgi:hypothetical protein
MEDLGYIFLSIMRIVLVIVGTIALAVGIGNWDAREQCRLMEESGFSTQIKYSMGVTANCFIFDDSINRYIPIEKFRSLAD